MVYKPTYNWGGPILYEAWWNMWEPPLKTRESAGKNVIEPTNMWKERRDQRAIKTWGKGDLSGKQETTTWRLRLTRKDDSIKNIPSMLDYERIYSQI